MDINEQMSSEIEQPLVSIITPSFNRANVIEETAQSIFSQTYSNWEWVIVEDGSTDNSWEILKGYASKDKRVKIYKRHREPKGACTCRNIAVEKSSGDYLIFLDSDDLLASFCIQQRIDAAKHSPESDFIIFPMLLFTKQPDDLKLLWNIETGEDDLARVLRSDPICQGTGTLWKKKSFVDVGMWKEELAVWQDIELHIRSMLNHLKFEKRMDLLPDVFIRISEVSMSRTGFYSIKKVKSRMRVFEYVLEKTTQHQKNIQVMEAIRYMGLNMLVETINSSHFSEAENLINRCVENKILDKKRARLFKTYLLLRKYKGYKFPMANKYFNKRIQQVIPPARQTVGTIPYSTAIVR